MTKFKTRKKDKQVFTTEEIEIPKKKDDYAFMKIKGHAKFDEHGKLISPGIKPKKKGAVTGKGSKKPDKPVRSFKGTKFELAEDGFKSKTDAQKVADNIRKVSGVKVRVKNIYGTWEVWTEHGKSLSIKEKPKKIEYESAKKHSTKPDKNIYYVYADDDDLYPTRVIMSKKKPDSEFLNGDIKKLDEQDIRDFWGSGGEAELFRKKGIPIIEE